MPNVVRPRFTRMTWIRTFDLEPVCAMHQLVQDGIGAGIEQLREVLVV